MPELELEVDQVDDPGRPEYAPDGVAAAAAEAAEEQLEQEEGDQQAIHQPYSLAHLLPVGEEHERDEQQDWKGFGQHEYRAQPLEGLFLFGPLDEVAIYAAEADEDVCLDQQGEGEEG
ncbi:hypothetical protein D3C81_1602510 [compost metagenome]